LKKNIQDKQPRKTLYNQEKHSRKTFQKNIPENCSSKMLKGRQPNQVLNLHNSTAGRNRAKISEGKGVVNKVYLFS
jgi:hypothetical protein